MNPCTCSKPNGYHSTDCGKFEVEREVERIKIAVRECDTAAEQTGDPVESYRIAKAPWHRLIALTGSGPHPQSEAELWKARAKSAEDALREIADSQLGCVSDGTLSDHFARKALARFEETP